VVVEVVVITTLAPEQVERVEVVLVALKMQLVNPVLLVRLTQAAVEAAVPKELVVDLVLAAQVALAWSLLRSPTITMLLSQQA
jgi:multisubunit Na+/H+ antiporter MnhG subunit